MRMSEKGNEIVWWKVQKEGKYILCMCKEEILEVMCGVEYMGKVGRVGEVGKGIEMEV